MNPAVTGAGIGSGVVIAWAWNALVPSTPMPAEVAAALGGLVQPVLHYAGRIGDAIAQRLAGGDRE